MSAEEGISIKEILGKVEEDFIKLEEGNLPSNDPSYMELVQKNIERTTLLKRAINSLNLFSSNENIKELNTSYISFFLVFYYCGYFYSKDSNRDIRAKNLENSKDNYRMYITLLKQYELIDEKYKKYIENPSKISTNLTRDERIQKMKDEKVTRQKIKDLKELMDLNEELQEEQDDLIRELSLLKIEYYLGKCLDEFKLIEQELEMLHNFRNFNKEDKSEKESIENDLSWRLDNLTSFQDTPTNLLDHQGKPLRPFVITGHQQHLRDQVFKPGYRLPTMTIDEYLKLEMERGNFLSGGGGERPTKKEVDDMDFEGQDKETMRLREWDEFKDHNPRGSGNRGNKG